MSFVAQQLGARDVDANVLTDGRDTCTYAALPDIFANLRSRFHERGIDPEVCLAFECENSLLSALVLLFLLEDGHDFLLLPTRKQDGNTGPLEVPSFCGYQIAASRERFTDSSDSSRLADSDCLDLTPNPGYRKGDGRGADRRMYVRTSGSTGTPKLAVHTHGSLWRNALNCIERYQLESTDRVTIPVPLSHMYGLGAAFLPNVAVGASIDLQNGANLLGYIARERDFQPNRTYLTPTFCESLLKGRKISREYKLTVSSGDRLRGETFASYEDRFGPVVQQYGCTELGAIAATRPGDPAEARAHTVGTPFADVEVCLGDAAAVQKGGAVTSSEVDQTGELWCRHPYGFQGYADESGVLLPGTQALADGWFYLRDVARIGPDGRIRIRGRADHAVNRSGLLVLFTDIEASIMTIPEIDTAVVVASGESDYGAGLAVFCVPASGATVDASDIYAACLELMPRREIPDVITVTHDLPRLSSGKVDRPALTTLANTAATDGSAEREVSGARSQPC